MMGKKIASRKMGISYDGGQCRINLVAEVAFATGPAFFKIKIHFTEKIRLHFCEKFRLGLAYKIFAEC